MAKTKELAEVESQTGAMVIAGVEQTSTGSSGSLLGRLAMYNGTTSEEATYEGCDFKRGNWIDVMEKRKIADSQVNIVPVCGFISWERFDQQGKLVYATHERSTVPAEDLEWPEQGQKNSDGKFGPLASEVWNFVVLVQGEPWPYLLRFKRTGVKAGQDIAQLEARYATNGTGHRLYQLSSKQDKNAANQAFLRIGAKPVGQCPADMLPTLAKAKAAAAAMLSKAKTMADEDAAGSESENDGIPI